MTSKLITTVVAATIAAAASAAVYDVKFTAKTINDKGKFGTVTIQGAYDEATGLSYFWDRKTKAPIAGASFGAEMNVTEAGKKVLANAELVWDNNKSALVVGSSGTDTSLTGNFGGMIDEVPAYGTYSFKASKKSIEKIVPASVLNAGKKAEFITGSKMAAQLDELKNDLAEAVKRAENALEEARAAVQEELAMLKDMLAKTELELATTNDALTKTNEELTKTNEELTKTKAELTETVAKLEQALKDLEEARKKGDYSALIEAIRVLADSDNPMIVTTLMEYLKGERDSVAQDIKTNADKLEALEKRIGQIEECPAEVTECHTAFSNAKDAKAKAEDADEALKNATIERDKYVRFKGEADSKFMTDPLVLEDTTAALDTEKAKYVALDDAADIEAMLDGVDAAKPKLPAYDFEAGLVSGYNQATNRLAELRADYTNAAKVVTMTNVISTAIIDVTNFLAKAEAQLKKKQDLHDAEEIQDAGSWKHWKSNITGEGMWWSTTFRDFFLDVDFSHYHTDPVKEVVKFEKGEYSSGSLSAFFDLGGDYNAPGSIPVSAADQAKIADLWKLYRERMDEKLAKMQEKSEKAWDDLFEGIQKGIDGLNAQKAQLSSDLTNCLAKKAPHLDAADKAWMGYFAEYYKASNEDVDNKEKALAAAQKAYDSAVVARDKAVAALEVAAQAADDALVAGGAYKAAVMAGDEKAMAKIEAEFAKNQSKDKADLEKELQLVKEALARAEAAKESIDLVISELEKPLEEAE